jgi:hypothetical protein
MKNGEGGGRKETHRTKRREDIKETSERNKGSKNRRPNEQINEKAGQKETKKCLEGRKKY